MLFLFNTVFPTSAQKGLSGEPGLERNLTGREDAVYPPALEVWRLFSHWFESYPLNNRVAVVHSGENSLSKVTDKTR